LILYTQLVIYRSNKRRYIYLGIYILQVYSNDYKWMTLLKNTFINKFCKNFYDLYFLTSDVINLRRWLRWVNGSLNRNHPDLRLSYFSQRPPLVSSERDARCEIRSIRDRPRAPLARRTSCSIATARSNDLENPRSRCVWWYRSTQHSARDRLSSSCPDCRGCHPWFLDSYSHSVKRTRSCFD